MYESLNYAKRKYSNEATDEWDSAVEGVVKHSYPPKKMVFGFSLTGCEPRKTIQMRHCTPATRKSSKP